MEQLQADFLAVILPKLRQAVALRRITAELDGLLLELGVQLLDRLIAAMAVGQYPPDLEVPLPALTDLLGGTGIAAVAADHRVEVILVVRQRLTLAVQPAVVLGQAPLQFQLPGLLVTGIQQGEVAATLLAVAEEALAPCQLPDLLVQLLLVDGIAATCPHPIAHLAPQLAAAVRVVPPLKISQRLDKALLQLDDPGADPLKHGPVTRGLNQAAQADMLQVHDRAGGAIGAGHAGDDLAVVALPA